MREVALSRLPLGPYQTNCYLLSCPATQEGIIVDPSAEPDQILRAAQGLKIRCLFITHTHFDHLQALSEVQKALGVPVLAHSLAAQKISVNQALQDGDALSFGEMKGTVFHTPGHTPDSLCLLLGKTLIAGDTIFPGGPGKTASPEAFQQILHSLEARIWNLPDETMIYPGHGGETTVGQSRAEYQAFRSRPHPTPVYGDVLWLSS
ncbi:MAG: MBL fold metallo-hydrolase [Candidatus Tectomicrobia bacterium]|uniref:MBL fold metallo-hydrolase n=1 Tax=Tectimicrobiota bacterium TaxID=2528274 RepID=A0A932FYJ4_UNCTE|nr:MBL fold metallo-hydrolase [Candidatus Tectomicrobia bacterium]